MTGPRDQGPQGQETLVRAAVLPCTSVNNERQRTSEEVRGRLEAGGWRRLGLPRLLSRFCPLREGGTKGPGATVRLLIKIRESVRPALAGA